eukprot:6492807-Amphidinium_carterae.8
MPSAKTPRKRATVLLIASGMLNGDWREGQCLIHVCSGHACCPQGRVSAVEKMEMLLGKLLKSVRPSVINRGNWLEYHKPFSFLGLLHGMHGLLTALYQRAFATQVVGPKNC